MSKKGQISTPRAEDGSVQMETGPSKRFRGVPTSETAKNPLKNPEIFEFLWFPLPIPMNFLKLPDPRAGDGSVQMETGPSKRFQGVPTPETAKKQ